MFCPSCKKRDTSIVSEKYDKKTNSIKRNRYCVCGNSFETHEKIKKSEKRNPKLITLWKNCRICLYAVQRLEDCLTPMVKEHENVVYQYVDLAKKIETGGLTTTEKVKFKQDVEKYKKKIIYKNLTEFFAEGITKKGGKNYFQPPLKEDVFHLISTKNMNKIKLLNKKETINRIVNDEHYWGSRNHFLNKPIEDMKDKSLVRKESQEYYKSVCDYIKQPQYNKEFFIQHQPQMEPIWNRWWDIYLKIR